MGVSTFLNTFEIVGIWVVIKSDGSEVQLEPGSKAPKCVGGVC